MKIFDYILKNGHVIDPENGIDEPMDVAIGGDKIAQVAKHIAPELGESVVDAGGLYVTPGLTDAHIHCYYSTAMPGAWAGELSLQPDHFNFQSGVTTMVDVGTSGCANFEHFRATVIEQAKTKIYALLNIADYGMATLMVEQFPETNHFERFVEISQKHADVIKGIKIAHYWGKDWRDVEYAKRVQAETHTPIMVDFGVFKKERPYDELLMERLDAGDITTHCYRGPVPMINENGKVYNYLHKARERGILFDMGHGAGSFILRNAVPAMRQGFLPDTISTDLHALSVNSTTFSLTSVMSKVMACCDLSLFELFRRVTVTPRKMFGLDGTGSLSVGARADVAVFNLHTGVFGFKDVANAKIEGTRKLECEMTFCNGELVYDLNARTGVDYTTLPKDYGIDYEKEALVMPTHMGGV